MSGLPKDVGTHPPSPLPPGSMYGRERGRKERQGSDWLTPLTAHWMERVKARLETKIIFMYVCGLSHTIGYGAGKVRRRTPAEFGTTFRIMTGRVASTIAHAAPWRTVGTKSHSARDAPVDSTYFSLPEAAAAHLHKRNNMHMTMHANLHLLHMVLGMTSCIIWQRRAWWLGWHGS